MTSRLERWMTSQNLSVQVIATLCGMSTSELNAILQGAQCTEADKYALELLFGDVFTLSEILTSATALNEREIMRRLSYAFAEQCRRWTGRAS